MPCRFSCGEWSQHVFLKQLVSCASDIFSCVTGGALTIYDCLDVLLQVPVADGVNGGRTVAVGEEIKKLPVADCRLPIAGRPIAFGAADGVQTSPAALLS